jgi:alpha-ketoglutaric semialdehyde dehydrogenase
MPEGVFSLLFGDGNTVGQSLVRNGEIKAVGFTGSRRGGLALMRIAAQRLEPIPVYAEMSSINPVFLLPAALADGTERLAQAFVESLVLGAGQFCTNPGLLLALDSGPVREFIAATAAAIEAKPAATMLTPGIHEAYACGVARVADIPGVRLLARGEGSEAACAAQAVLYTCDIDTYRNTPSLQEEIFGPCSLLITCSDFAEMRNFASQMEGQLTATIHATSGDDALAAALLPVLERKVGRILFNGFPTGVEVSHAMVHGGPFPSTSDGRSTSVGASSIDRFLRPVCYQNFPANLLPPALSDENPLKLVRLVDGAVVPAA